MTRLVEAWGDDVAEGKVTDFRNAVEAKDGENVVFSWFEYPDKAARDAANEKMMSDPRMEEMGDDMPFDGKRMIMGGFDAIVEEGERRQRLYTDGFVVPVPEDKQRRLSRTGRQNGRRVPRVMARCAWSRPGRRRRTTARSPTSTAR